MKTIPTLLARSSSAPLISCVMPTYGRPDYVNESVAMFLSQEYSNKELVVLNDCPGQRYEFDHPEVCVVNRGERYVTLGEKRNDAIDLARGSVIAVWDDDDVYLPWRLSFSWREMSHFRTPFYRAAEFWAYWGESQLHHNQSVPGWVSHPNTLYTKALWREVGRYPAQGVGEDAEFFDRIHQALDSDFLKYPIEQADRFFVLRGSSKYAHMSMSGGKQALDTRPGNYRITPTPIADPILSRACRRLIVARAG